MAELGWRKRWREGQHGGIPSTLPCVRCHLARDLEDLCHECRRGRACAPGTWRGCAAKVPDCGPFCARCPPYHDHPQETPREPPW